MSRTRRPLRLSPHPIVHRSRAAHALQATKTPSPTLIRKNKHSFRSCAPRASGPEWATLTLISSRDALEKGRLAQEEGARRAPARSRGGSGRRHRPRQAGAAAPGAGRRGAAGGVEARAAGARRGERGAGARAEEAAGAVAASPAAGLAPLEERLRRVDGEVAWLQQEPTRPLLEYNSTIAASLAGAPPPPRQPSLRGAAAAGASARAARRRGGGRGGHARLRARPHRVDGRRRPARRRRPAVGRGRRRAGGDARRAARGRPYAAAPASGRVGRALERGAQPLGVIVQPAAAAAGGAPPLPPPPASPRPLDLPRAPGAPPAPPGPPSARRPDPSPRSPLPLLSPQRRRAQRLRRLPRRGGGGAAALADGGPGGAGDAVAAAAGAVGDQDVQEGGGAAAQQVALGLPPRRGRVALEGLQRERAWKVALAKKAGRAVAKAFADRERAKANGVLSDSARQRKLAAQISKEVLALWTQVTPHDAPPPTRPHTPLRLHPPPRPSPLTPRLTPAPHPSRRWAASRRTSSSSASRLRRPRRVRSSSTSSSGRPRSIRRC